MITICYDTETSLEGTDAEDDFFLEWYLLFSGRKVEIYLRNQGTNILHVVKMIKSLEFIAGQGYIWKANSPKS